VPRRRVLLLLLRPRPQGHLRLLVAASPRVQPVFLQKRRENTVGDSEPPDQRVGSWKSQGKRGTGLQVALDLVVGEPVHLHQLPDLLGSGSCKFSTTISNQERARHQRGKKDPSIRGSDPHLARRRAAAARRRTGGAAPATSTAWPSSAPAAAGGGAAPRRPWRRAAAATRGTGL
jgi:hypothetical protein